MMKEDGSTTQDGENVSKYRTQFRLSPDPISNIGEKERIIKHRSSYRMETRSDFERQIRLKAYLRGRSNRV